MYGIARGSTDPALADGVVAVAVVDPGGGVHEIHEYKAGGVLARSYELGGEVATVDRAGRVYDVYPEAIHVFAAGAWHEGRELTAFPVRGRSVIAVDHRAVTVLIANNDRIALFDLRGHVRWSIAAPTAIDVSWIEDEPRVRFISGLARLDRRDGHMVERACGWDFGLTAAMPGHPGDSVSVCDAE